MREEEVRRADGLEVRGLEILCQSRQQSVAMSPRQIHRLDTHGEGPYRLDVHRRLTAHAVLSISSVRMSVESPKSATLIG